MGRREECDRENDQDPQRARRSRDHLGVTARGWVVVVVSGGRFHRLTRTIQLPHHSPRRVETIAMNNATISGPTDAVVPQ